MQRRERKDEGLALAREPVLLRADSNQIKASRREQSRRVSRTGFLPAEYRSNREAYLCDASRERFGFNNYDTGRAAVESRNEVIPFLSRGSSSSLA